MILILAAICGEAADQQDASDLSEYILPPKAAPTQRINGARIFGVRPGSEFLFTIAVTPNTSRTDRWPSASSTGIRCRRR